MTNAQIFTGQMALAHAARHVANRAAMKAPEGNRYLIAIPPGPEHEAVALINRLWSVLEDERIEKILTCKRRNRK